MKHVKLTGLVLALALSAGLTAPVCATGYAGDTNYYQNHYYYNNQYHYYYGSENGSGGSGGTTVIVPPANITNNNTNNNYGSGPSGSGGTGTPGNPSNPGGGTIGRPTIPPPHVVNNYYRYYYVKSSPSRYSGKTTSHTRGGSSKRDTDPPRNSGMPVYVVSGVPVTYVSVVPVVSVTTTVTGGIPPLVNNNGATVLEQYQLKKTSSGHYILTNVSVVKPTVLKGVSGIVNSDVVINGVIAARWYLDAAKVSKLENPVDLSMSIDARDTGATQARYNYHYKGNFRVISLGHKYSFGTSMRLAVNKSLLKGVDLSKLKVLVYDQGSNTHSKLSSDNIKIEGNYVYFNISRGGELIFTDSSQF